MPPKGQVRYSKASKCFRFNGLRMRGKDGLILNRIIEEVPKHEFAHALQTYDKTVQEAPISECNSEYMDHKQAFFDRKKDGITAGLAFHSKMERHGSKYTQKGTLRKRNVRLGPREMSAEKCLTAARLKRWKNEFGVAWQGARIATKIDRFMQARKYINGRWVNGYVPVELKSLSRFEWYRMHRYRFRRGLQGFPMNLMLTKTDTQMLELLLECILANKSFPSYPLVDAVLCQTDRDCRSKAYRLPSWVSRLRRAMECAVAPKTLPLKKVV
jgi:hypothetical protein